MKYPRNTRIFRGQLDVAPVACVFFMTALLLFLHSQIVFVPGVRLDLQPVTDTNKPSLFIDGEDVFHYAGNDMSRNSFVKRLKADAEKSKAPSTILFQADPGASTNSINAVRAVAADLSIELEPPGSRISLPASADPGSTAASIIVAVNASGQFFYEDQLVPKEADLQARLTKAAGAAREPLTLVLRMDRDVAIDTFVRLSEMARQAGFQNVVVATRPALKTSPDPLL